MIKLCLKSSSLNTLLTLDVGEAASNSFSDDNRANLTQSLTRCTELMISQDLCFHSSHIYFSHFSCVCFYDKSYQ